MRNYHFTEADSAKATEDDLDVDEIREYLRLSSLRGNTIQLDKKSLMRKLSLLDADGRPKNSSILMFSPNPEEFIPGAFIEFFQKQGKDETVMSEVDIKGPIWKQAKKAMQLLSDRVIRSFTLRSKDRMENRKLFNYPYDACEELLTNAIVHKDYENGRTIQIYAYPDRIVIINFNMPLLPVTLHSLNHDIEFPDRDYENPSIREMFKSLGLMETYGSGIGKARSSMKENGSESFAFKEYEDNTDITMVTIPINKEFLELCQEREQKKINIESVGINIDPNVNNIESKVNIRSPIENSDFSTQVKNNMSTLYAALVKKTFGRSEVIALLNCSPLTAINDLKKMKEIGLLEPVKGQGKSRFRFRPGEVERLE